MLDRLEYLVNELRTDHHDSYPKHWPAMFYKHTLLMQLTINALE